jgi:class 3 adenylate cyclase
MSVKNILLEIEQDIVDVYRTNFVYSDTALVPNAEDPGLTYERGAEKKGKKLTSCVLYVDIRNSVALTEKHHSLTMGKIYTSFTKAILKVARHHGGHTRNIIGDRVMIVFPEKDCFTHAVDCAISINHIIQKQIRNQFSQVDFKCGIGIDYGELKIIKVGIQRYGTESGENKGLVWTGYPANIASRLTDNANKVSEVSVFEVLWYPSNPLAIPLFLSLESMIAKRFGYSQQQPLYQSTAQTVTMTAEEFINGVTHQKNGEFIMNGGKVISFSKATKQISFPPILMTEIVYNEYKKANKDRLDIKNNFWTEQLHNIKNVTSKVYGGDVHWVL